MNRLLFLIGLLSIAANAQTVKVMTYNLRVDFGGDGENNWEFRRDMLAGQIAYQHPDFIGTQEGKAHQLEFLEKALNGYAYIGLSRDNSKTEGEFSAIFYNTQKFRILSQNTFWLSPTPEVKSKGWDAAYERICTYGLFEEIATQKRFWIFNTHLDQMGETARVESAKLIVARIQSINTQQFPYLITGDFNSEPSSGAYRFLSSKMRDAKAASIAKPFGPSGTFNGFKFHEPVTMLIDYIFVGPTCDVLDYAVLSDSKDCRYPSDHLPVVAQIKLRR